MLNDTILKEKLLLKSGSIIIERILQILKQNIFLFNQLFKILMLKSNEFNLILYKEKKNGRI